MPTVEERTRHACASPVSRAVAKPARDQGEEEKNLYALFREAIGRANINQAYLVQDADRQAVRKFLQQDGHATFWDLVGTAIKAWDFSYESDAAFFSTNVFTIKALISTFNKVIGEIRLKSDRNFNSIRSLRTLFTPSELIHFGIPARRVLLQEDRRAKDDQIWELKPNVDKYYKSRSKPLPLEILEIDEEKALQQ